MAKHPKPPFQSSCCGNLPRSPQDSISILRCVALRNTLFAAGTDAYAAGTCPAARGTAFVKHMTLCNVLVGCGNRRLCCGNMSRSPRDSICIVKLMTLCNVVAGCGNRRLCCGNLSRSPRDSIRVVKYKDPCISLRRSGIPPRLEL